MSDVKGPYPELNRATVPKIHSDLRGYFNTLAKREDLSKRVSVLEGKVAELEAFLSHFDEKKGRRYVVVTG